VIVSRPEARSRCPVSCHGAKVRTMASTNALDGPLIHSIYSATSLAGMLAVRCCPHQPIKTSSQPRARHTPGSQTPRKYYAKSNVSYTCAPRQPSVAPAKTPLPHHVRHRKTRFLVTFGTGKRAFSPRHAHENEPFHHATHTKTPFAHHARHKNSHLPQPTSARTRIYTSSSDEVSPKPPICTIIVQQEPASQRPACR